MHKISKDQSLDAVERESYSLVNKKINIYTIKDIVNL
jgi:hypothetical protein